MVRSARPGRCIDVLVSLTDLFLAGTDDKPLHERIAASPSGTGRALAGRTEESTGGHRARG
ncbi:hypothetical protein GCM10023168_15950 [Fodinibacter luteus]|uniref:Uncharacterized protein n=1 Tax=Fodinibacter luteus TaxID=552064 RepID=A0ABP8KCP0_9MICO